MTILRTSLRLPLAALACATALLGACAEADDKALPEDLGSTKADSTISNSYTTIVGALPLGEAVADTIDYPEFFLGRTLELRAGQVIEIAVRATRKSLVHAYGPAYAWDGERPLFTEPLVRTTTTRSGSSQRVTLELTAPTDGTYLLVYGPTNVWRASYRITATCVDGCEAPIAEEGEACGGFRPPGSPAAVCAPGLACVGPYDLIPDIPGRCGVMTTVADLLANPAAFDGRYVAIRGLVDSSLAACTKIGCPVSNPCCNTCTAEQRLFDAQAQVGAISGLSLSEGGATLACSGDSCNYQDSCPIVDGGQWMSGWFHALETVAPTLTIDRRFATF